MCKDLNIAIHVYGEMVKNKGEDSRSSYTLEKKGYIGVYDGCGGIGAKRYAAADQNTGAYLASRLCALMVYQWVKNNVSDDTRFMDLYVHEEISDYLCQKLSECKKMLDTDGGVRIKGGLSKSFPTTAAMFFYQCTEEKVTLKFMWAGDSRGYVLDSEGLGQVTADDIDENQDAFSNLSNDSKLENMINADKRFCINEKTVILQKPCVALVATDGVFGYIPTPMEFEYMLLTTLQRSASFDEWRARINKFVSEYASDDYTLSLGVFGFEDFEDVKAYYSSREKYMYDSFIKKINRDRKKKNSVDLQKYWKIYASTYERYLNQG